MQKFDFDSESGMGYITLSDAEVDTTMGPMTVTLDFDELGNLVGVEILGKGEAGEPVNSLKLLYKPDENIYFDMRSRNSISIDFLETGEDRAVFAEIRKQWNANVPAGVLLQMLSMKNKLPKDKDSEAVFSWNAQA